MTDINEFPPQYSTGDAYLYGSIGISGTTYEIGFYAMRDLLGDVRGKFMLDFGCGSGRSSQFLLDLGVRYVCGVDHNLNMIRLARHRGISNGSFLYVRDAIPIIDNTIDAAIAANVFIEIRTIASMTLSCHEICRTLRPGAKFVMMSANPRAYNSSFSSFSRPSHGHLHSGDQVTCVIAAPGGLIEIEDTYWQERDYLSALEGGGFAIEQVCYPVAKQKKSWMLDEASVAPFLLVSCVKP